VEHRVRLVVPTIDPELVVYAAAVERFAEAEVSACISSPSTVCICGDKIATHAWLIEHGFPAVRQTNVHEALRDSAVWPLPLIAKPYNGSASVGLRRIETRGELEGLVERGTNCIVQEIAPGREFTINVYVDRFGKCICAVPHWRMEVRAGEVSKGVTVKHRGLIELGRAIAEKLPGARGPLNIQCFMDDFGNIRVIEMNARFGGGYPLAHSAGARFTDWLLNELDGRELSWFEDWTDDLAMLRYDEAIFVSGSKLRI
jgi:carbamoyl-phosphate synthase large subunit